MALKITFAVSTWLWASPFTTETISLFPKIKAMGFDAVEIPVEDPALIDTHKVREALLKNNLKPIVCGVFGTSRDFTSDNPALHKNSFEYIQSCFTICENLDAKFLCGPMYSAVGKARLVSADQKKKEWERAVKNLEKVCRLAEDKGLEIALEPLNRFESDLINTAEDVMKLVADINHPSAKVMLDGFHMNIEEPSAQHAIELTRDKLIHFQVSENYRGTPGSGQTRWDDIKKGLTTIAYEGCVTIESFTPENKELSAAVCIWKPLAPSQDELASNGISFLKKWAKE